MKGRRISGWCRQWRKSTESEASAAETSSESSGSFIDLLREDIEGQQDYFDHSVGGSGESALLQAGCEVVGEITWVCPDGGSVGADLSGMNLRFARMNQALLFGADLSGVDATGANFTDIYAPNATFRVPRLLEHLSTRPRCALRLFQRPTFRRPRWIPFRCRALTSLV